MSFRKSSIHEFQHQSKDIRSQFVEQIKSLEQRTSDQSAIFQEINDFVKKRAELDLQYSKELDKLVKSVMLRHKNERQRRTNWSLYSTCNLWQNLVDDAKEEAKQRSITAEIYSNYVVPAISNKCVAIQKISKKCREIVLLAQGEVVRVINELSMAMKTYQHCFSQFSILGTKLQQADEQKRKAMDANSSARKQRAVQKTFDKKNEKYEVARQKCTRARNEYILCIDAANASLYKYFADDVSDLVDCSDLGLECWLGLVLQNVISARKAACQTEMNALANLSSFKDSLQSQVDKQRFFESNHQIFMLPKRFHFKSEPSESISRILTGNLAEEFKQRHDQIRKRLNTLRAESGISWKSMEEMERQMRELLTSSTLVEINEFGIADHRPPVEEVEGELSKLYEQYMQTFSFFLLNANLITRLEARADGIGEGLNESSEEPTIPLTPKRQQIMSLEGTLNSMKDRREEPPESLLNRRKRRIGSQASTELEPSSWGRPRLFGGGLEEYAELTGEQIPLVVISCIRVLSQYALQHQGVFRISGSQIEINRMREAFEGGEDPLKAVGDASDANSIASLLKLYLRELREPLFPFYLFDLLTDCAKCSSAGDFISKISPLLNKLPRPAYLLLRYLFAFLNHLSEFSDENMMDPYNLAICFGPTLLPIPEGKDQVIHQNSVNEVVKNLIVHCEDVFIQRLPGPRYEKYNFASLETPAETELELFMDDELEEQQQEEGSILSSQIGGHPQGSAALGQHNAVQQQKAYTRLPFLANFAPPTDQISQSLMEFSTCSANSSHFPQQEHQRQIGHSTGQQEVKSVDFSNNYSSTESGIDNSLLAHRISGLRLISPSQKREEPAKCSSAIPANNQRQRPEQIVEGLKSPPRVFEGGKSHEQLPTKTEIANPADLYASIKRKEQIRIPVSPSQFNKPERTEQAPIPSQMPDYLAGSGLTFPNETRPPSYQSLFQQARNMRGKWDSSERNGDDMHGKSVSAATGNDGAKKAAAPEPEVIGNKTTAASVNSASKAIDDLLHKLSSSLVDDDNNTNP